MRPLPTQLRPVFRGAPWLAVLVLCAGATPAGRPAVDPAAMRDAMAALGVEDELPSSASYAHFLKSRLHHHEGDHRAAADELRLALATNDDSAFLQTRLAEERARLGELGRAERLLRQLTARVPAYFPAHLLLGRILLESGKSSRAQLHLRKAIQLRPESVEPYLALAQLHLEAQRPDEAVKAVEALGLALPGEVEGFKRLGLAFAERGDTARAERMLVRAAERDPGDFDVAVQLGQLYEGRGRLVEAEAAFARALEREPDHQDALMAAGRVALKQGALPSARAYLDRLLTLSDDPEVVVRVAFAYLSYRQLEQAAQVLDDARVAATREPRISFYAGLVHQRMRQFDRAARAYAEVPESSELFEEARAHRAASLSLAGDHARALALFRAGLQSRPGDAALKTAYARALERSGAFPEAEALLREALANGPQAELYDGLSTLYLRRGMSRQAVAVLTEALARFPRQEVLLYALGMAYEQLGEATRAIAQMRAVLELNPQHASAMNFIGYVLAERGTDFDEAERLILRALELRPDTASFLDSLGWVYYRRGEYARAVETLERAAALAPDEPIITEHLGDAYRESARHAEAARAYRRALDALALEPDGAEPADQRTQLERKLKMLSSGTAGR